MSIREKRRNPYRGGTFGAAVYDLGTEILIVVEPPILAILDSLMNVYRTLPGPLGTALVICAVACAPAFIFGVVYILHDALT